MYVSTTHKIAFHANPRTGSRSIRDAMYEIGAVRVGDHHNSLEIFPKDGWTIFCVVRPIHEVIASIVSPGGVKRDYVNSYNNWVKDGKWYWRADLCTHVLRYPDLRVPGMDATIGQRGITGHGEKWREYLPEDIIRRIGGDFKEEYKRFGWPLPVEQM